MTKHLNNNYNTKISFNTFSVEVDCLIVTNELYIINIFSTKCFHISFANEFD